MTQKVAVITSGDSDFLQILCSVPDLEIQTIPMGEIPKHDLDEFSSFFLLGGTESEAPVFSFDDRLALEAQLAKGKKFFSEYFASIGEQYHNGFRSTRFSRMIFTGSGDKIRGVEKGDLLEDQCNTRWIKHYSRPCKEVLLIAEENIPHHRNKKVWADELVDVNCHTLWVDTDNLMICTFRLCNFIRANFSPKASWRSLVEYIIWWVTGKQVISRVLPDGYTREKFAENKPFREQIQRTEQRAMGWALSSGLLVDEGRGGYQEGYGTEIYPDGSRKKLLTLRDDCVGEMAMFFGMDHLLTGNARSLQISDNLMDFIFDKMQIKEGPYKGMLRWSETAWPVAYSHDTGRAILGEILKNLYLGRDRHIPELRMALDFLIQTTGSDGIRPMRTDTIDMDESELEAMHRRPLRKKRDNNPTVCDGGSDMYSLAAMLMFYKLTGEEKYRRWGVAGMEANLPVIDLYLHGLPNRYVTGYFCGLMLPLSVYYHITGEDEHRKLLYDVTNELSRYKHPLGGYVEWYKGEQRNPLPLVNTEGGMLVENGEPIMDNLYSLNWLSMGFSQAYLVTGDPYFKALWEDIAKYYTDTQIVSSDPCINGAWARAEDRELSEIYGIPNDVGWGPWAVESGWTIGQIGSGLAIGLKAEELLSFYN